MKILGVSAYYHDSAACLIVDGEIIAAAQEERFTRKKHDSDFPINAIQYCLIKADISPQDINYVVFYDKPFSKFERILETYLAFAPLGFKSFVVSLPIWIKEKLFQKNTIIKTLNGIWGNKTDWSKRLLFSEHHLSHAASAFFPSPFEEAAILTMDGVGEWTTTSLAIGKGSQLTVIKEIFFPHSIGLLYSAFTYYLGFKVNSGEYKLMGLAPYGEPIYAELIKEYLIDIKDDGSFHLDISYFNYCTGLTMTSQKFNILFKGPPRKAEADITQREMDIAASIQLVTEEIVIKLATNIAKTTGQRNLCLAGGVALNCVINGKLIKEKIFDEIWIQPAAGDAGGAIGAAFAVYYSMLNCHRKVSSNFDSMKGSYLGPEFFQNDIEKKLSAMEAVFRTYSDDDLIKITAQELVNGKAVGWFQGRMEFGPRALGNRSIIADPRSPSIQKQLNLKVKFRESFRPFAPSVLNEDVEEWFDIDFDSPYMLFVAEVAKSKRLSVSDDQNSLFGIDKLNIKRSLVPAITHVDYSARIQTVHQETNPRFYKLINKFKELTGCPMLVNTSFNIRGEPIVGSPEDAFNCFIGTNLDVLVIGNSILFKSDQTFVNTYIEKFDLD